MILFAKTLNPETTFIKPLFEKTAFSAKIKPSFERN